MVKLSVGFHQQKVRTESVVESCRRVSLDGQSTAARRTILCKCRHDDVATCMNAAPHALDVQITVLRAREEMEDRAVVPDVKVLGRQICFEDVPFQPRDATGCRFSQTLTRARDRSTGQIKDCDVCIASFNELVHQQ